VCTSTTVHTDIVVYVDSVWFPSCRAHTRLSAFVFQYKGVLICNLLGRGGTSGQTETLGGQFHSLFCLCFVNIRFCYFCVGDGLYGVMHVFTRERRRRTDTAIEGTQGTREGKKKEKGFGGVGWGVGWGIGWGWIGNLPYWGFAAAFFCILTSENNSDQDIGTKKGRYKF
jgi:hypothetical protein